MAGLFIWLKMKFETGSGLPVLAYVLQVVLFQLTVQGALTDPQFFSNFGTVTIILVQQRLDMGRFDIGQ